MAVHCSKGYHAPAPHQLLKYLEASLETQGLHHAAAVEEWRRWQTKERSFQTMILFGLYPHMPDGIRFP